MSEEKTTTALQSAMIEVFGSTYTFGANGQFSANVADMSDNAIVALFRYGRRLFNDNWNSSKDKAEDTKTQAQFFEAWLPKLGETVGTGSGGHQVLSYAEKAERAVVRALLIEQGSKAKAATEAVKDLEAAWEEVTTGMLVAEFGDDFDPKYDRETMLENVPTVQAAFQELIAIKAEKLRAAATKPAPAKKVTGLKL